MRKSNFYSFCILVLVVFSSCKKDGVEEATQTKPSTGMQGGSQNIITSENGNEGLMEFADATPNPYTIENMQLAYQELIQAGEIECNNLFNIRVTHKYIKFKPQDTNQYQMLISDSTLILFDHPLHRKLTRGGTYYRDPSLSPDQFNYQWTCVKADKALPEGVPYDILDLVYIPDEDPLLVQYEDTPIDGCVSKLMIQALSRTGNFDTTANYDIMTSGGELQKKLLPSKWTPAGTIRLTDNSLNNITGLAGAKVRVWRLMEIRETLTDHNGNYNMGHRFRFDVNYSIKWERNDFQIRSGRYGQAYFNGPNRRGNWNLDIVSGVSWHYGQVHRAAFDYYYNNPTGLRTPPTRGFLGSRITFGVFDEKGRAFYRRGNRNWFGPEIFIYTSEDAFGGGTLVPNSLRHYETSIHELAHASHFNLSHWHYRNSSPMVKESWAVGVAWAFARLKYSGVMNLQTLWLQGHPTGFDVIDFGERKYTPLVIDLIDNFNQRGTSTNLNIPIDRVSGYSIRNIEDALVNKTTMNAWRDQLKTNKPSGVTDAQVDELFQNYIPLQ